MAIILLMRESATIVLLKATDCVPFLIVCEMVIRHEFRADAYY
jgi:hypothetical protein